MRIGRSGEGQAFHGVEKINHGVELFNHGVELFFNTDIENFLTIKSGIKWVIRNYLKVLFITSPLWVLSISYLMK